MNDAETIHVDLKLTRDTSNSMNFVDTYEGLQDIWYKFESDSAGNINLYANRDGFEHLARYFLKMARTDKRAGFHGHHSVEFGSACLSPELTIMLSNRRNK